jgi:hypothetical protein|tara:strand:- start:150 stop:335 length:186 start_codon:yes stop_codon:yes gene_type:complete
MTLKIKDVPLEDLTITEIAKLLSEDHEINKQRSYVEFLETKLYEAEMKIRVLKSKMKKGES